MLWEGMGLNIIQKMFYSRVYGQLLSLFLSCYSVNITFKPFQIKFQFILR